MLSSQVVQRGLRLKARNKQLSWKAIQLVQFQFHYTKIPTTFLKKHTLAMCASLHCVFEDHASSALMWGWLGTT